MDRSRVLRRYRLVLVSRLKLKLDEKVAEMLTIRRRRAKPPEKIVSGQR